uniref:Uncharacterized protein n=1 Tax=Entomoneis paludosa TaxID=265537 RepID=A0A7S2YES0_9STRA|mmetsp:Transcript_29789/g.62239  ORF Transcript_29789/g.62239 Transcript_29789/m.62239 type:complete len:236 (+) Transcript_29789:70-777(+)|eukprot:CAMPEP_0172458522 /NCGR_PEP_ID=MMETSP1065-20121228/27953_1 /TAXON_ID=265537 /ORGANISM="Amphiprora paludosa, Strain CCMP125" /LENGTH=235 /DNA_ID=CAMNT_0013212821 /DNA_START=34 /DNA_END=741 /DNA_ORIENTATION=-
MVLFSAKSQSSSSQPQSFHPLHQFLLTPSMLFTLDANPTEHGPIHHQRSSSISSTVTAQPEATATTKESSKATRRVHFAPNLADAATAITPFALEEFAAHVWYTPQDLARFKKRARLDAKPLTSTNTVEQSSGRIHRADIRALLQTKKSSIELDSLEPASSPPSLVHAHVYCGLERWMKCVRREKHVQRKLMVLQLQQWTPETDLSLAETCRHLTATNVEMAQQLAEALSRSLTT